MNRCTAASLVVDVVLLALGQPATRDMDFLHFILLIPFVQPSLSFAGVHPQLSPQQVDHYRSVCLMTGVTQCL